jgi:predicted RNase H-like HicB family nuclease
MDAYEVELESAEPEGFVVTVPSLPGLLILGATSDEVLSRTRASIAFHLRAPVDRIPPARSRHWPAPRADRSCSTFVHPRRPCCFAFIATRAFPRVAASVSHPSGRPSD